MNKPVVIDSSAFISLGTVADSNYKKATLISDKIQEDNRAIVMPGDVFTEILNIVGKKVGHKIAIEQANHIFFSKAINVEEINSKIRQSAFEKFKMQPNSVSFTDCSVMAFADEFETKEIFGFDEAFRKNGYLRIGIDEN